jgi:hypothetical protein
VAVAVAVEDDVMEEEEEEEKAVFLLTLACCLEARLVEALDGFCLATGEAAASVALFSQLTAMAGRRHEALCSQERLVRS